MVNSNTKLVNHLWHANLILFACLCQRKWKVTLCNQISQQWQGTSGKSIPLQSTLLGKKAAQDHQSKDSHGWVSLQLKLNLILLIKTLSCCAIKLVCLQEFLDHFPLLTRVLTPKNLQLSLLRSLLFL